MRMPGKKFNLPNLSICKETKLKEFQLKLIRRIVVTKKELHRYGITADDECLYCGEKDSIDLTFLNCRFVQIFVNNLIDWFKVIPQYGIAHPYCARFSRHQRVQISACTYTTKEISFKLSTIPK